MVKTYIFLIAAIFCEVAGTMLLPVSQNFTKLIPTVALSAFYLTAFYLLTFVVRQTSNSNCLCNMEWFRNFYYSNPWIYIF